jgi:hypothetical protein
MRGAGKLFWIGLRRAGSIAEAQPNLRDCN